MFQQLHTLMTSPQKFTGNYTTSNQPFPQGEVLISGGNVVQGYMNDQEKTAEDFVDINGRRWFCTGDIGEFQPNGNLKIIDRKKDMVKLSHGEYVSLAKIETRILTCPLVDNVCAYGDSTYPYLVALIVPNKNALLELAEKVGEQADSLESACANEAVEAAALKEIRQHCQQNKLDKSEIPMKIHLCTEVWTPAMGILTEAYKLKRKPIEMKYKQVLDNLYSEKSKK